MEWRKQDWFWLTGILVVINMFIFAFRLSDNQTFMEIFSFMVNGISIALAFVAMYTSFKQNSDNQTLTTQMSETMARMDEKINSMGQRVSEFSSVEEVKKMLNNRLNIAAESIEETLNEEEGNISKSEVIDILNKELSNFSESLDSIIQKSLSTEKNDKPMVSRGISIFNIKSNKNLLKNAIENEFSSTEFTMPELREKLREKYNEEISLPLLRLTLLDLIDSEYLVKKEATRNEDGLITSPIKYRQNEKKKIRN